jgi:hypothetical protein
MSDEVKLYIWDTNGYKLIFMHQDDDQSVQQKPYDPNDPATHVAVPSCYCGNQGTCYSCLLAKSANNTNQGWHTYAPTTVYNPNAAPSGNWTRFRIADPLSYPSVNQDDDYELDDGVVRCCGEEAKWVNNGIGFRYWYCSTCKDEVDHPDNDPKKP